MILQFEFFFSSSDWLVFQFVNVMMEDGWLPASRWNCS